MSAQYTYPIAAFPNHKVASDRLTQEIQGSVILTALDYINTNADDCDIWFRDTLSTGDKGILDSLVASHSGEPLPQPVQAVSLHGIEPTPLRSLLGLSGVCQSTRGSLAVNFTSGMVPRLTRLYWASV